MVEFNKRAHFWLLRMREDFSMKNSKGINANALATMRRVEDIRLLPKWSNG